MYTIVLADDEKNIVEAMNVVVKTAFPTLAVTGMFYDGKSLMEYLSVNHADIVITDIEMPGINGLEAAKFLKEKGENSYVIIITAYHRFEYALKALDYRADAFLPKPFSSVLLETEIRKGLEKMMDLDRAIMEKKRMRSHILSALYQNPTYPLEDYHMTDLDAALEDAFVYEAIFQSENGFPEDKAFMDMLYALSDTDAQGQDMYFVLRSKWKVAYLVFAKKEADLTFVNDFSGMFEKFTGDVTKTSVRTYENLTEFLKCHLFSSYVDSFSDALASFGLISAKETLREKTEALKETGVKAFFAYLQENYGISGSENVDEIAELLSKKLLGNTQGNYLVNATREYILTNYADSSLSLDLVADYLNVSAGYLSRIFKNAAGRNFSDFLQDVRMENARRLLKTTIIPTNRIALMVGYSNATYFRTAFKMRVGMTPRQYRLCQTLESAE